jgi:hypothetical protein
MKFGLFIKKTFRYIIRKVLVYDLILLVIAALSFVITGGFSALAFSERLFWVGVIVFLIAGTMALAHMVPARIIMFPYNIRKPEDAKRYFEQMPEHHMKEEKRIDDSIQVWLIALVCLGMAAFIQTFLT